MDTLTYMPYLVIAIGTYVFFECFTAINEMKPVKVRHFYKEFVNPYTLKYWGMGLYALAIILYSDKLSGWYVLTTIPAILCVMPRTFYRVNQLKYLTNFERYVRFRYFLVAGLSILLLFVFAVAKAESLPNIQCNSGNLQLDYQCMRDNWRPKKQISYDTGRAYCDSSEGVLHGKGEIRLNVDDTPYVFKIDCK